VWKGENELDEFNVRVFYDKLEDQNLHLASQLAKHQEDLRGFYERISAQNDDLKRMLQNLDVSQLEEAERQRSATDGPIGSITNISPTNINRQYKFTNATGREAELMAALQLLVDKLNSGNIQVSPEMLEKARTGGASTVSPEDGVSNL
jgi:hypothetical protein